MQKPIATCENGKVSGTIVRLNNTNAKPVCCFRNIPFAKPPIGELRFVEPQPADSWEGIRDGSVVGYIPFQNIWLPKSQEPYFPQKSSPGTDEDMSEDCLHLSVYTPVVGRSVAMPVMVWFYGGSFQHGSERLYEGSALAGMYDVVVVVPNYRENVFGFLSLAKGSLCPGNAGLWDQHMALRWVQRNISEFGGDPKNVTIFGHSAGAVSVNLHINSPASDHLFHKAISHSGQANVSEFFSADGEVATKAVLKILGIGDTDPDTILRKLQQIPVKELKRANDEMIMTSNMRTMFLPCVDGKFLTKTPEESLAEKTFSNNIPYMIGCTNSECRGGIAIALCGEEYLTGITEEKFKQAALFQVEDASLEKWKKFYFGNKQDIDEKDISKLYGQVSRDKMFVVPAVTTANAHAVISDSRDVYFYQCCFQLRMFHDESYGPKKGMKPSWCYCDHGDDVCMMLGVPFTPGELQTGGQFSKKEEDLSRKCMAYITNFAKRGNPNAESEVDTTWPKYTKSGKYIILNHETQIETNLAEKEVKFWTNPQH